MAGTSPAMTEQASKSREFGRYRFVIPSISANPSALSVQSMAFKFCSTCSTRVAPAMTLDTCGRDASHDNASSSMVWPRVCAKACNFSTISSLRGVT
jgi:hypothetical protein